jgi:RNA polymerase sigma factor (sigma-70 family)
MTKISDNDRESGNGHDAAPAASDVNAWFVQEVLPLEVSLKRFLRLGWHSDCDLEDMCQDVFVRTYEAARNCIPHPVKPFVFSVARNLLINRLRREQIVSIEAVADLEDLGVSTEDPGPDRVLMARQELKRLRIALDRMPRRWRDAVIMRKIDGLSRQEIAQRMGLAESTVAQHLASGIDALIEMFHSERLDREVRP